MADPKVEKSTKTGGRVKGTPNKKTQEVIDRLKELNCDPIEGMAKIAQTALESDDLALAGQMYKELAQYIAPKRKAIEVTGEGGKPIEGNWTVEFINASKDSAPSKSK